MCVSTQSVICVSVYIYVTIRIKEIGHYFERVTQGNFKCKRKSGNDVNTDLRNSHYGSKFLN